MADIRKPGPKFPPTRLLEAGYGAIVSNGFQDTDVKEKISSIFSGNGRFGVSYIGPLHSPSPTDSITDHAQQLKEKLIQEITALKQSIDLQEQYLSQTLPGVRDLISAARDDPSITAATLSCISESTPTLSRVTKRGTIQCCKCTKNSLPFTKFCLDHIHLSRSQSLYRCCNSLDPVTKLRCEQPLSDILSIEPSCPKHVHVSDGGSPHKRAMGRGGKILARSRSRVMKLQGTRIKIAPKGHLKPKPLQEEDTAPLHIKEPTPPSTHPPRSSLDDLLTLGAPLQTLDLPPLEADLGDIMMAGEEGSDQEGD